MYDVLFSPNITKLYVESEVYEEYHNSYSDISLIYNLEYENPRYEQEIESYNKKMIEYDIKLKQYKSDLAVYECSDEYKKNRVKVEEHKKKNKEIEIEKLKKKLAELEK